MHTSLRIYKTGLRDTKQLARSKLLRLEISTTLMKLDFPSVSEKINVSLREIPPTPAFLAALLIESLSLSLKLLVVAVLTCLP